MRTGTSSLYYKTHHMASCVWCLDIFEGMGFKARTGEREGAAEPVKTL